MKKSLIILLSLMMILGSLSFASCKSGSVDPRKDGKIKIVCTIFPQYDWVKNILGEKAKDAEIVLLLDSGVDLHNFQPTNDDINKSRDADLFIYAGGESDGWVDSYIKATDNKYVKMVSMLDVSNKVEEEELEGMEENGEEHEEGEIEYDEHVWLSLKNAKKICGAICDAICEADPDNAELYKKNCDDYIEKLSELDSRYSDTVTTAERKVLLFADRFPFRYMAEDYGLTCYAAFSGCSAETEASAKTTTFLTDKLRELELPYVLIIEGSTNKKLAETIISQSGLDPKPQIAYLHSLQSVTADDISAGTTYLELMEGNLDTLKTVLN